MRVPASLQDTARTLGLCDWVHRRDFPLRDYCMTVDQARALVRRHQPVDEAFDPSFDQIMPVVAQMLDCEGALLEYALHHAHPIKDQEAWWHVCQAAAWEVLKRYSRAIENGDWTPS